MFYFFRFIVFFSFWLFVVNFSVFAAEHIENFRIDIVVNSDSSLDVTETIDYDFSVNKKYGIYRYLPVRYRTSLGLNKSIKIEDISVYDEKHKSYEYKVSRDGDNLNIRIGNKNKAVTGKHTYIINYKVYNAINYFDTHDELYWNLIGNGWEVPINNTKSMIMLDGGGIQKAKCFAGNKLSQQTCDEIHKFDSYVEAIHKNLGKNEGVTVVVGFNKGILYEPSFIENLWTMLKGNLILIFLFIFLPGALFINWWIKGRDKKLEKSIVPTWETVDNLKPAEIGYLIDNKFNNIDFVALTIDLAVRGYIKIKQIKENVLFLKKYKYELFLIVNKDNIDKDKKLSDYEKFLLKELYKNSESGRVLLETSNKDFWKNIFYKTKEKIEKKISEYFDEDIKKVKTKYTIFGIIINFIFFGALIYFGDSFLSLVMFLVFFISIFLTSLYPIAMLRKNMQGREVLRQIKGLKIFLEKAHKRQLEQFLKDTNSIQKTFEKMLPYAIVLGVVKEWGEKFKDFDIKNPDWYDSSEFDSFNPSAFGASMHNFSEAFRNASSASSGGSGFSGGSTGGGFGGGGGGSW